MTTACMRAFGVEAERTDYGWFIKGGQRYAVRDYRTEGDWSQAAFFMAGGALSGDVTVSGVYDDSAQGDREIAALLERFGAEVGRGGDFVRVRKAPLRGIEIDARQIPDLVPVLSTVACFAQGDTVISGAERLRIKESDRIVSTAALINGLGGKAEEKGDSLIITGTGSLTGGTVSSFNDHRIAMAAVAASSICTGNVNITDAQVIKKSYPGFLWDFNALGGTYYVL